MQRREIREGRAAAVKASKVASAKASFGEREESFAKTPVQLSRASMSPITARISTSTYRTTQGQGLVW